jgi:hypothetical protein
MEFEFTIFLDIDDNHFATATKDRTGLMDGRRFKPTTETGQALKKWLESGSAPAPKAPPVTATPPAAAGPAPAASYHPDTNDGPTPPPGPQTAPSEGGISSLSEAVKAMSDLAKRIAAARTRAEGAALWDEVGKALPVIGKDAVASFQYDLKAKAKTLTEG